MADTDKSVKVVLDTIPKYDYLMLSFAKPNLTSSLSGINGLSIPGFKRFIKALQDRGSKVILAVGGATYNEWAGLAAEQGISIANTTYKKALKNLMNKYEFDGLDVDYERSGQRIQEYTKSVLALREVVDSFTASSKILTIAGWSTGADCVSTSKFGDTSTYGNCAIGLKSIHGNRAGRERALFIELNKVQPIEDIFDIVNVMSYDGSTRRFDPVDLHKSYRSIYKGPLGLGLEIPSEGWGGAELTITHADAKACGAPSMLLGNSYSLTIDKNASYSMERFAKHLAIDAENTDVSSTQKNGFMVWHITKKTTGVKCSRAATIEDVTKAIQTLLFDGNVSTSPLRRDIYRDVTRQPAVVIPPLKAPETFSDQPQNEGSITTSEYQAIEDGIISRNPILQKNIESMKTFRDTNHTGWPLAGNLPSFEINATNLPINVQRVKRVFSNSQWDHIFTLAKVTYGGTHVKVEKNLLGSTYTYKNFLNAVAFYPKFCNEAWNSSGTLETNSNTLDTICKKELSTMFAHFAQEVGAHDNVLDSAGITFAPALAENTKLSSGDVIPQWRQGLFHVSEFGCREDSPSGCLYRECNLFECADGAKYFGRGAKQLSYNYNYIPFSITVLGDGNILRNDPSLVSKNGRLALLSAFYFYMSSRSPKPSIHHVVTGGWIPNAKDISNGRNLGFGVTIDIVNGGVECGGTTVDIAQGQNRIKYYLALRNYFGIPVGDIAPDVGSSSYSYPPTASRGGEQLGCAHTMRSFAGGGSADSPSFWERNWVENGKCKLVSYETKFSAFRKGEYEDCIKFHFK
jgi:chitodextrinase